MFFTQSCLKKYQELKPELSCLWKNQELSRMEKIIRMEGAGKKLSGSPALVPQLPSRHNDKILKMHILLFKILMNLSIYVFMYTYYKMNVTYTVSEGFISPFRFWYLDLFYELIMTTNVGRFHGIEKFLFLHVSFFGGGWSQVILLCCNWLVLPFVHFSI